MYEYLLLVIIFGIIIYCVSSYLSKQQKSTFIPVVDCGITYQVTKTQDGEQDKEVARVLCRVNKSCKRLIKYLNYKYGQYDPRVKLLVKEYDDEDLVENQKETFVLDKGVKIHLCVRSKTYPNKIYDLNLLMFVVLHELAHIVTISIGHDDTFWKNNVWLMREASLAGVFTNTDYSRFPQEYCGLTIDNNPSFNEDLQRDIGNKQLQEDIRDKKLMSGN